ncbi:MAG TPA: CpsD/CapB family tyrosine-protein kinase [Thermoflexia bacterium]|nr:CpsD/CapB family tyrosine-protein kinase [Thermoflexia bacterium]
MNREQILMLAQPQSPAAEAYRALRVNLTYAALDKPLQTLVIASPAPEKDVPDVEVAVNLAVAAAQAGERVILVDADLRRPSLHAIFETEQSGGLAHAITQPAAEVTQQLAQTEIPNLRLLPAGATPPNPADILSSAKMGALLAQLAADSELVILKSPPVTAVVDTPALAAKSDGLLLVTRSGHTRRDHIAAAQELLARFNVNLLGAVLTDAPDGGMLAGY